MAASSSLDFEQPPKGLVLPKEVDLLVSLVLLLDLLIVFDCHDFLFALIRSLLKVEGCCEHAAKLHECREGCGQS